MRQRIRLFTLLVVALSLPLLGALAPGDAARDGGARLVISGFYVAPLLRGGPEECVRIANAGRTPVDIAGYSLSDVFGPSAGRRYVPRGAGLRRDIVFPPDTPATRLQPGEERVVARDAAAYRDQFGALPDFEMSEDDRFPDDDPAVPNMVAVASRRARRDAKTLWPTWPAHGADVIALFAPPGKLTEGRALDLVVWDFKSRGPDPELLREMREYERTHGLPEGALWTGPALDPKGELASPYGSKTRMYIRDRDARGRVLPDTNSYRDWDAGSSLRHLGEDPTHRIEMAGQSHFLPHVRTERAVLTMSAGPDCIFEALRSAWAKAEREIRVSVYYFKSFELMDALLAAIERGVDVYVYLEGSTVGVKGGFTDTERYVMQRIEGAGRDKSGDRSHGLGRVYWLRSDPKARVADRYLYDHSKYSIIDGRVLIVGSENYGGTGHPVDPSSGNRGWEIQIATPPGAEPLQIVQDAIAVWDDDCDPENHADIIRYSDAADSLDPKTGRGRYGPPPADYDPEGHRRTYPGTYVPVRAPATVETEASFELVLSPDNSLNEHTGILGAIRKAEREILVQHLDLRLWWGSRVKSVPRSPATTPSLLVQALVEAARRGVRVRVLLDCSEFNCNLVSERYDRKRDNNDDTVAWLREIAAEEGLDIDARLLDVNDASERRRDDREDAGYSKIHNKGLVIDGRTVLISSINGSENSFKGNREMGVLVTAEPVADYYAHLFWYDFTTVAAPDDLRGAPGRLAEGGTGGETGRVGVQLVGLAPSTAYFFRVTAFDSDDTDVDPLEPSLAYGPHESAFSKEVEVRSSKRGHVALSWLANQSESREGDLAGYRVYFGLSAGTHASTPADAKRLGLYDGVSPTLGVSPVEVPKTGGIPKQR